ncbi:hypothetical protein NSTCB13_02094 [Nostoc sp. DSM 114160]|jgi:hypothetical protein
MKKSNAFVTQAGERGRGAGEQGSRGAGGRGQGAGGRGQGAGSREQGAGKRKAFNPNPVTFPKAQFQVKNT